MSEAAAQASANSDDILIHLQALLSPSLITQHPHTALTLLIHTLTQHPPAASHPSARHSLLRTLVSHANPTIVDHLLLDQQGARLLFDWMVLEDAHLGKQDAATGSANMLCRLLALPSPALTQSSSSSSPTTTVFSPSPALLFLRTPYKIQSPSSRHTSPSTAVASTSNLAQPQEQTCTALSIVQRWSRASSFSLKRSAALLLRRGSELDLGNIGLGVARSQLGSSISAAVPAVALDPLSPPRRSLPLEDKGRGRDFYQLTAHVDCDAAAQRMRSGSSSRVCPHMEARQLPGTAEPYLPVTFTASSGSSSSGRISISSDASGLSLPTLSPSSYDMAMLLTGGSSASSLGSLSLPKIQIPLVTNFGRKSEDSASKMLNSATSVTTGPFCSALSASSSATTAFPPLPCASMSFPRPMTSKYELAIFEYEGARREWAVNGMPPEVKERYQAWLKEQHGQSEKVEKEEGHGPSGKGKEQEPTRSNWDDNQVTPSTNKIILPSSPPPSAVAASATLRRPSLSNNLQSDTGAETFTSRTNSFSTSDDATPMTMLTSTASTPSRTPEKEEGGAGRSKKRKLDQVDVEGEGGVSKGNVQSGCSSSSAKDSTRNSRSRTAKVI
ncbi:hypothetical protein A4X13_0g2655 [Tilletia indica]|uniref:Uncharacterized protein n=1 Tax=Tilletia indica TaxID=43049 RepID=A0A177TB74_9BASI|nr:hypothetical protein A4X13_0g2655 [Tilletia indica]